MIRGTVLFVTLTAIVSTTVPQRADAGYGCAVGRITSLSANSITVFDKESRTFAVDSRTRYTNWPTQGAWQAIRRIDPQELYCGSLVAVHPRHDGTNVARWVQVATDQSDSGNGGNVCVR